MSNPDLDRLNRLRVDAGHAPLKSWKASTATLLGKIDDFIQQGYSDALPGAKIDVPPVVTPELKQELDTATDQAKQTLGESALMKNVGKDQPVEPTKPKGRAHLARGLDTDAMATHSRAAVRDGAEKERREKKAERKAAKEAAKAARQAEGGKKKKKAKKVKDQAIVGKVDEKREPEKAARQKKHIADKQAARAAKPKVEKDKDNFTVADLSRELDIDPKTARNKLRRHEDKIKGLHTKGQDRWTFPNSAKKDLTKILTGGK